MGRVSSAHNSSRWVLGCFLNIYIKCSNPNDTGMARLALSEEDKQVRDWFKETTEALGCTVTVDAMGNMFAVRPGRRKDVPATFVGSHLDTQPTGGRYDGILGVCAGIEMLKVLEENGIETEGGVGVANWTKFVFSPCIRVRSNAFCGANAV